MTSLSARRRVFWAAGFRPRHSPGPEAAGESGYVLLLVLLVSASVALALYNELPRVAFHAQRDREELLIERGEQYKRAIQLFVRKAGRYPATIEELESLDNNRFLRKRYLDPMTGKPSWRLIHINGGVLTDSLVQKAKPGPDQQQANTNTFIGEGPAMNGANNSTAQQINPAMQRRASDSRPVVTQEQPDPPAPGGPNDADGAGGGVPDTTAAPASPPPATASQQSGMPAAPPVQSSGPNNSVPAAGGVSPGNGAPSSDPSSASSVYIAPPMGQSSTGIYVAPPMGQSAGPAMVQLERRLHGDYQPPGTPRAQPVTDPVEDSDSPPPTQTGAAGAPTDAGQSPAAISNGNTPTPAGTLTPPGGLPTMGSTQVGGGIAGVASQSVLPTIKIYNGRNKYDEWEFVYDRSKDRSLAGVTGNGGTVGTPAASMGAQPGSGGLQGASGSGGPAGNPVSSGPFNGSSSLAQPASQPSQTQQFPN
jgi:hypothetical protein